jgi:acyl-CoA thioester hydrolase
MYTYDYTKRVRYGETDQMGYVYYGNYPQYYEIGRVEMMRSLGMSYRVMESEIGIMMPVMHFGSPVYSPGTLR